MTSFKPTKLAIRPWCWPTRTMLMRTRNRSRIKDMAISPKCCIKRPSWQINCRRESSPWTLLLSMRARSFRLIIWLLARSRQSKFKISLVPAVLDLRAPKLSKITSSLPRSNSSRCRLIWWISTFSSHRWSTSPGYHHSNTTWCSSSSSWWAKVSCSNRRKRSLWCLFLNPRERDLEQLVARLRSALARRLVYPCRPPSTSQATHPRYLRTLSLTQTRPHRSWNLDQGSSTRSANVSTTMFYSSGWLLTH